MSKNGIVLLYFISDSEPRWLVHKVVNSILYNPGQVLGQADVKWLCGSEDWKVEITEKK